MATLSARLIQDAPTAQEQNDRSPVEQEEYVLEGLLPGSLQVDSSEEDNSPRFCKRALEVSRVSSKNQYSFPSLGWPLAGNNEKLFRVHLARKSMKIRQMEKEKDRQSLDIESMKEKLADMDLMKERFSKLLLGEDMSGGSKGVSSALALSNAITNLSASIFCELWRLEPLSAERKARWRKEIDWLLSVTDCIVELVPTIQQSADGNHVEVMVAKQRSDLLMNIPALRKLDAMLLEILENFHDMEFWYEDRTAIDSFKEKVNHPRQEHKWWLPTPKVPEGGLQDGTRKLLQNQRDAVKQILKAVLAINAQVLSEMEIPDVYLESLPKTGKASLGDVMYRHITAESFSPDALFSSIDLSTEHNILDIKNRIEASLSVWERKSKDAKSTSLAGWGGSGNHERREVLGERAETLLLLLKHRYPGLPQTVLDMNKIQYNKDVGQSILESYSRVLESRAFNIMSRIDDVLYADGLTRIPPFPSSFHRSPSHNSMRTNSMSEDKSSFWTSSPSRFSRRTQSGSPSNFEALASENYITSLPRSMTLSDFMGWTNVDDDNLSNIDKLSINDPLSSSQQDKSTKKLGLISTTNKRLSYVEKLESPGLVHSPAARD